MADAHLHGSDIGHSLKLVGVDLKFAFCFPRGSNSSTYVSNTLIEFIDVLDKIDAET